MIRFATTLDDLSTIARLIYETDRIIPYLFGKRQKAIKKIESLVSRENNIFSYQNIVVYEPSANNIQGILLAYSPQKKDKQKENEDYSQAFSILELFALWFKVLFLKSMENKSEIDGLYISNISVDSSARGGGIGTKLISFIEEWASAKEFTSLWLDVAFDNPKAKKLYEKQGFTVVSERQILFSKNGFFRMKKSLKQVKNER
ncbi:MAG: GNAT family N-acetyltransferase [Saprospiraceae bacterium]|nr:GNAT family N-acetyltransferase [Saprospiraceae bacterium]